VNRGFTLVELMVALAIGGLVLAVSVPASMRMYQSMQYRSAVRDVIAGLATARHLAITSGRPQDLEIDPRKKILRLGEKLWRLPEDMIITIHSAKELNYDDLGVIRFYPEGGASGGGVDIESPRGAGVKITVDWLMGQVSQTAYAVN
jgi:general secretion pathway protein H